MITAGQHLIDATVDPRERASQNGRTRHGRVPHDAVELVGAIQGRESSRQRRRSSAQHIDGERAGVANAVVGIGAPIDTDEHERWFERERGHGIRRQTAGRTIGTAGCDDGHARDPVSQNSAEFGGIECHALAVAGFRPGRSGPVPGAMAWSVARCLRTTVRFGSDEPEEVVIKHAPLAGCLIIASLAGCDNVSWGGADVTIVPPPAKASGPPEPGVEPGIDPLPEGPILYHVEATAGGGRLSPVAEIAGDSVVPLRPSANPNFFHESFIAEHLRQGAEFVLFRGGVRAGTFVAQAAAVETTACGPAARATGLLELSASAADVREFLALAKVQAPQIPRRTVESIEPTRTMRVLAPILADQMLRSRRAPLPGNWERALAQLRPFARAGTQDLAFTATFLIGDTLGPGLDDAGASLFFVGLPARMGFDTVFVEYRDYANGGKAAPSVVDGLDWDRDDQPELLLRVYGTSDWWFEAVGTGRDGVWRRLMRDRCAAPAPPAPATAPAATTDTSALH